MADKEFTVTGRFVMHGTATVRAQNLSEARDKFNNGDFDRDPGAECVDWQAEKVEENDG